jgi:serine/threonine-protein kinase
MIAPAVCPDVRWWHDFLDGKLSPREQVGLAEHLEDCPRCQQTLERLTDASGPWAAARAGDESAPGLPRVIARLKATGGQPATGLQADADEQETIPFLRPPRQAGYLGRLGSYDVVEVIGRGGMGVVLKAADPGLNRFVAIKVLAPQWATSAAARARFAREARATAAVRHEHVVAVYAVEEADDVPYLVMEYVHGASLQQRLDQVGPLEVEEVVRIGAQTAAGLAAAHARGLIHRDVKPANILLEHGLGRVKLSDFGLARAVDDARLTQSGVIAGTPLYMAPEQARGAALDHRADLFSLGSVLYALCTGRPPFRAPTTLAVLRRVSEDMPRPIQDLNPQIPDWLVQIIAALHAKDPDDRLQSAAEVAQLLDAHLAHLQNPQLVRRPEPPQLPRRAGTPNPRGRRRWLRWVAAALCLGLVAVAAEVVCWSGLPWDGSAGPGPGALTTPVASASATPRDRPDAGPVPTAVQPVRLALTDGKVHKELGKRLSFNVQYHFEQGGPASPVRLVWVVQSGKRTLVERPLFAAELGSTGTLSATTMQPVLTLDGPLVTFLAVEKLVPGQFGPVRETVSNTLTLRP